MKTGFVVSDLHLLAPFSHEQASLDAVGKTAHNASCLVLNGDIFDFKNMPAKKRNNNTVKHAISQIKTLVTVKPERHIHYIIGSHDNDTGLIRALEKLDTQIPTFHVHKETCTIENNLFTHGHLFLFGQNGQTTNTKSRKLTENIANWLIKKDIGPALKLFFSKKRCAQKLLEGLKASNGGLSGITDIYFAATHVPFTNFVFKGVRFHNTGAATRRQQSHMLPFNCTQPDGQGL